MQGAVLAVVIRTGDLDLVVLDGCGDRLRQLNLEGALGTLNVDNLAVDGDLDALRDGDRC